MRKLVLRSAHLDTVYDWCGGTSKPASYAAIMSHDELQRLPQVVELVNHVHCTLVHH